MADDEHLAILADDGSLRFNSWRSKNSDVELNFAGANLSNKHLANANLSDINFTSADFSNADLSGVDFSNADLTDANLQQAHLNNANLSAANFTGANLRNAVLNGCDATGANLENSDMSNAHWEGVRLWDANLRGAEFASANFTQATINENTLGVGRLSRAQKGQMIAEEVIPEANGAPNEPNNVTALTVGQALNIIGPANSALQSLIIPNDLKEEDRDLIDELKRQVTELENRLAELEAEKDASEFVGPELPLWKRAFETLVLQAVANVASQGAAFSAGFIAGMLYHTCSPDGAGLWT